MLSVQSFWTGTDKEDRRKTYAAEYNLRKAELEANAKEVVERIQAVADIFEAETEIKLEKFSSGWRPESVNDPSKLTGAGLKSNHLDARAGDVHDTPEGEFAWWCFHNQEVLQKHALWMEHPSATVLLAKATPWTHLQSVPPKSGMRVYFPNSISLSEWQNYVGSGGAANGGPLALRA